MTDNTLLTDDGIDLTDDNLSLDDLRAEDHLEVKAETDTRVVFMDGAGYELTEWAEAIGVSRSELSERMHALARETYRPDRPGDPWSVNDPLVIAK